MGLIDRIFGGAAATTALGNAAKDVAEVFTPNRTRQAELSQAAYIAALDEAGAEFATPRAGRFDVFVNALNRLPRPMLAFGTLGLFVYAMVDPVNFGRRMVGLQAVPEPLWWLLGAIVSFYFGAREAHYFRLGKGAGVPPVSGTAAARLAPQAPNASVPSDPNPALDDWRDGK